MKSHNQQDETKSQMKVSHTVNACGSRCPLPLLYAKQALKKSEVGDVVKIYSTDPSAKGDFEAMLKHLPHQLIEYELHKDEAAKSLGLGDWSSIEAFYILKASDEDVLQQ